MKRKVGFEVLENAFRLEFSYPNIFYLQNFLFALGVIGCGFWLLLSQPSPFQPTPPGEVNYFAVGIGYLTFFTVLSRFQQDITMKKLLTVVNFVLGFMIMSTSLRYDIVSAESAFMSLFYIAASIWGYALINYLTMIQTSYSSVLLLATPLVFFGAPLMILRNPVIFIWSLILFIFIIGLLKFLGGSILDRLVDFLPKHPFVFPAKSERSFFDIMNLPKMYPHSLKSNSAKTVKVLLLEHLFWFFCSPIVLLPLVSLLDLRETQERDAKNKLLQFIRQSPVRGMITPGDAAGVIKAPKALAARYLSDLAKENSWNKYSGKIILFADPSIAHEDDLKALEFSERLMETNPDWMPLDPAKTLHAICFSYRVDSVEKLVKLTGMEKKRINNMISLLEKKGIVKRIVPETPEAELGDQSLERILERAKIEYRNTLLDFYKSTKAQVLSKIRGTRLPPLSTRVEGLLVDMVFKAILSCSRLYQKEFGRVGKKADELGKIRGLVYEFSFETQMRAIQSLFRYVRDEIPTQGKMIVKYPWITQEEGGLCTSLSVLLASMLRHLGFFVGFALIAPKDLPAHSFVTVLLRKNNSQRWLDLDPSHYACEINKIHPDYQLFRKLCYEIRLHEIDEADLIKSL